MGNQLQSDCLKRKFDFQISCPTSKNNKKTLSSKCSQQSDKIQPMIKTPHTKSSPLISVYQKIDQTNANQKNSQQPPISESHVYSMKLNKASSNKKVTNLPKNMNYQPQNNQQFKKYKQVTSTCPINLYQKNTNNITPTNSQTNSQTKSQSNKKILQSTPLKLQLKNIQDRTSKQSDIYNLQLPQNTLGRRTKLVDSFLSFQFSNR